MVIETEILPLSIWLPWGLLYWLAVVGGAAFAAVLVGWLVAALRSGPVAALRMTGRTLAGGAADLVLISPRRVWALSWLAVKESIRRRVVVVFAVFVLILLFAGWFLDPGSNQPARLYLSFVLTATSYLVLLLALFLSSLSLPGDIKNKTLHTVVTKPVRPSEIVLGRILGFTAMGTFLLVIMGLVSYVFVVRGLSHTHTLTGADLQPAEQSAGDQLSGRTSRVHQHRHEVIIDVAGGGRVKMEQGHWHELTIKKSGERSIYQLGPPKGLLVARVPVYGKLHFKDRTGKDAEKGVNVGDEWTYRSYIEGGSLAAAVWTFDGVTEAKFPDGLPLELTIEVFRTYKGDTSDPEDIPGILGSLAVRNPKTGEMVEAKIFTAKDFATDLQFIPRKLQTADGRTLDLFRDLVADGRVEIWLRCLPRAQYFGAAQPDLYLRAHDASFKVNFAKGYLGIWFQMVLVIGIGVLFSTFLSGPVAVMATLGALLGGLFSQFMARLATGEVIGGGPFEAFIRLVTQQNLVSEMEPGLRTTVAQMLDVVMGYGLWAAAAVLPDFGSFSFADYVAYGFDISPVLMLQCAFRVLAFLLPVFVAAYFFLKMREVAK